MEMEVPVSKYSTSWLIMKAMIISHGVAMRWQRQSEAKGNLGYDPGLWGSASRCWILLRGHVEPNGSGQHGMGWCKENLRYL